MVLPHSSLKFWHMDPLRYQILKETNLLEVMFRIASCTFSWRGIPLAIQSPKLRMGIGTSKTMRFGGDFFFWQTPIILWQYDDRFLLVGSVQNKLRVKKKRRALAMQPHGCYAQEATEGKPTAPQARTVALAPRRLVLGCEKHYPSQDEGRCNNFWGSTRIWAFYVWILNLGRIFFTKLPLGVISAEVTVTSVILVVTGTLSRGEHGGYEGSTLLQPTVTVLRIEPHDLPISTW